MTWSAVMTASRGGSPSNSAGCQDRLELGAAWQPGKHAECERCLEHGYCHPRLSDMTGAVFAGRPRLEPRLDVKAIRPVDMTTADLLAHHPQINRVGFAGRMLIFVEGTLGIGFVKVEQAGERTVEQHRAPRAVRKPFQHFAL